MQQGHNALIWLRFVGAKKLQLAAQAAIFLKNKKGYASDTHPRE
jgi:hypothetical protein